MTASHGSTGGGPSPRTARAKPGGELGKAGVQGLHLDDEVAEAGTSVDPTSIAVVDELDGDEVAYRYGRAAVQTRIRS